MSRPARSADTGRLSRLLAMVPYLQARPGIRIDEAAADLGLTEDQLIKDIEQLFVCGLPGYSTDDLIDIQYWEEDGRITVLFTAGIDRPLRLTGTEANVLLVSLQTLLDSQGALDGDAIRRAIAKIEGALGTVPAVADADEEAADLPVAGTIRRALEQGRALKIRYYTPGRDAVGERIVDPIRVQLVDAQAYLDAWCRNSDGRRLFRFDRVEDAQILDEPSRPPADASGGEVPMPSANRELPSARLEIDPEVIWLLEYYDVEPETTGSGDTAPVRARMSYGSPAWLARLLSGFGGRVRLLGDDPDTVAVRELMASAAAAARAEY